MLVGFLTAATVLLVADSTFTYKDHLRNKFEAAFHKKCDKYPFVQSYVNKLDYTDERYLTFVYQQPGLRNGGLGDRLGGLISAVAMSIRFNRTLLIRAQNDVHKLFRPYHPVDIHSSNPKYNWQNWTSWSHYSAKYTDNDNTEFDMWDCINNVGSKNRHCGLTDGDVGQPHILLRSNRAYLCHYDNSPGSAAFQQMEHMGVNKSTDLFEVAGCMLRLALWPTDYLWEEVSKLYETFEKSQSFNKQQQPKATRSLATHKLLESVTKESKTKRNLRSAVAVTTSTVSRALHSPSTTTAERSLSAAAEVTAATAEPFYQVGLHFRCGDKSFLHREGDMCVFDPVHGTYDPNAQGGNAYFIALCAREVMNNYTANLLKHHHSVDSLQTISGGGGRGPIEAGHVHVHNASTAPEHFHPGAGRSAQALPAPAQRSRSLVLAPNEGVTKFEMAFITSDNEAAAQQMSRTLNHPFTLISPPGCHIEMDGSVECHVFTVSYWMLLSFSDALITQTLGEGQQNNFGPTSSFSRYAGIYGLNDDPFRNSRNCGDIKSNLVLSRLPQSNWFC